jgi:hypothetical protein
MKILANLLLLILFTSCDRGPKSSSSLQGTEKDTISIAEEQRSEVAAETLDSPGAIQLEYAAVSNAIAKRSLDSVSFKYNCKNEKGGIVTCFSEKGKVRMLRHSYHEYDHYEATEQYFVKDSALFFLFSKELSWSFDSNAPETGGTKDNLTERRLYIVKQQAVKCLEKKYVTYSYRTSNPPADKVANKEVKCPALQPVQEKYEALLRFVKEGGKGCPVD